MPLISHDTYQQGKLMHGDPEGERDRVLEIGVEPLSHYSKVAETELKSISADCNISEFHIMSESFAGFCLDKQDLSLHSH